MALGKEFTDDHPSSILTPHRSMVDEARYTSLPTPSLECH